MGSPTRDILLRRLSTIKAYAHFSVRKIGHDEAEGTGRDVKVREDGYNGIVVNPVESFAKVN